MFKRKNKAVNFIVEKSYGGSMSLEQLLAGWGGASDEKLILENPIASSCVRMIARAVSEINPVFTKGDEKVEPKNYVSTKLLMKPNPLQTWDSFIYELVYQYSIYSRAYILRQGAELRGGKLTKPVLLYPLCSSKVGEERENNSFLPKNYKYGGKNYPVVLDARNNKMLSQITKIADRPLYTTLETPHRVKSIKDNIITYNLMDGFVRALSGTNGKGNIAIKMVDKDGNPLPLTNETKSLAEKRLLEYTHSRGELGNILRYNGEITQIGDNELLKYIIDLKNKAREEIALFFQVPVQMLNDTSSSTYNNASEVKYSFYTQVIIPLLKDIIDFLQGEIIDVMGDEVKLSYDENKIDAIKERRMQEMERLEKVNFLSINEKRQNVGLEEQNGGDILLVSRNLQSLDSASLSLPENFEENIQRELLNATSDRESQEGS